MSQELVVGNTNVQNTYAPWPNQWNWHNQWVYPQHIYISDRSDEYANVVEVEQNEHDATLRFYRKRGNGKSLVKTVTVPISLLNWLQGTHESSAD